MSKGPTSDEPLFMSYTAMYMDSCGRDSYIDRGWKIKGELHVKTMKSSISSSGEPRTFPHYQKIWNEYVYVIIRPSRTYGSCDTLFFFVRIVPVISLLFHPVVVLLSI